MGSNNNNQCSLCHLTWNLNIRSTIHHPTVAAAKSQCFNFVNPFRNHWVFLLGSRSLSFEICSSYASSTKELQIETKYIWKWCKWRSYYVHNIIRIIFYLIWFQMFSSHSPFFLHILISNCFFCTSSGNGLGLLHSEELILMKRKINSIFYSIAHNQLESQNVCYLMVPFFAFCIQLNSILNVQNEINIFK